MLKQRFHWLVGALLICSAAAQAADGPAAIGSVPKLSIADYERHIRVLAADEFEGRKPGTAGERKTIDYLVEQFKAQIGRAHV